MSSPEDSESRKRGDSTGLLDWLTTPFLSSKKARVETSTPGTSSPLPKLNLEKRVGPLAQQSQSQATSPLPTQSTMLASSSLRSSAARSSKTSTTTPATIPAATMPTFSIGTNNQNTLRRTRPYRTIANASLSNRSSRYRSSRRVTGSRLKRPEAKLDAKFSELIATVLVQGGGEDSGTFSNYLSMRSNEKDRIVAVKGRRLMGENQSGSRLPPVEQQQQHSTSIHPSKSREPHMLSHLSNETRNTTLIRPTRSTPLPVPKQVAYVGERDEQRPFSRFCYSDPVIRSEESDRVEARFASSGRSLDPGMFDVVSDGGDLSNSEREPVAKRKATRKSTPHPSKQYSSSNLPMSSIPFNLAEQKSAEKVVKTTEPKKQPEMSWGKNMFRNSSDWKCSTCLGPNPESKTKCMACGAEKNQPLKRQRKSSEEKKQETSARTLFGTTPSNGTPTFIFGAKPKEQDKTPESSGGFKFGSSKTPQTSGFTSPIPNANGAVDSSSAKEGAFKVGFSFGSAAPAKQDDESPKKAAFTFGSATPGKEPPSKASSMSIGSVQSKSSSMSVNGSSTISDEGTSQPAAAKLGGQGTENKKASYTTTKTPAPGGFMFGTDTPATAGNDGLQKTSGFKFGSAVAPEEVDEGKPSGSLVGTTEAAGSSQKTSCVASGAVTKPFSLGAVPPSTSEPTGKPPKFTFGASTHTPAAPTASEAPDKGFSFQSASTVAKPSTKEATPSFNFGAAAPPKDSKNNASSSDATPGPLGVSAAPGSSIGLAAKVPKSIDAIGTEPTVTDNSMQASPARAVAATDNGARKKNKRSLGGATEGSSSSSVPSFTFGSAPASNFSSTTATTASSSASASLTGSSTAPTFEFGASTNTAGQKTNAPSFSFGSSTQSAPQAESGFKFNSAAQAPASGGASFSFGSKIAAPAANTPGFGGNTPAPAANTSGFGGNTPAPAANTSGFGGNTPAPAANTSGFGGNLGNPTATPGFSFGTTSTTTPAPVAPPPAPTPGVNFGTTPAPPAAAGFNQMQPPPQLGFGRASAPGGFGFGGGTPAALPAPGGFGGGTVAAPPAPGSFGFSTPQPPAGGGGFSIGTGGPATTGRRGRRVIRAKRPPSVAR